MASAQTTPEVLWAQRSSASEPEKNFIYLTISVPDVPKSSMKLDLQPTSLSFTGTSETKKTTYHVDLEFYAEIDVESSTTTHTARDIEMILRKKELKEEYWPRLLKDKAKMHFLKTDFDKWVDEDEQNEAPDDSMNNFGAGGMGGMGGMGGEGGLGGIDFSKLGAGGGMGGMGDMEGLGDGDEGGDDSDDEMPELGDEADAQADAADGDKPSSDADKGKAKIEEVA